MFVKVPKMLHVTSQPVVTTNIIDHPRVREIRKIKRKKLLVTFHSTVTIIGENNSIQKVVMRPQPLLSTMFHALSQEEKRVIVKALAIFALKCHLPESDVQKVLESYHRRTNHLGKLSSSWDQTALKNIQKRGSLPINWEIISNKRARMMSVKIIEFCLERIYHSRDVQMIREFLQVTSKEGVDVMLRPFIMSKRAKKQVIHTVSQYSEAQLQFAKQCTWKRMAQFTACGECLASDSYVGKCAATDVEQAKKKREWGKYASTDAAQAKKRECWRMVCDVSSERLFNAITRDESDRETIKSDLRKVQLAYSINPKLRQQLLVLTAFWTRWLKDMDILFNLCKQHMKCGHRYKGNAFLSAK